MPVLTEAPVVSLTFGSPSNFLAGHVRIAGGLAIEQWRQIPHDSSVSSLDKSWRYLVANDGNSGNAFVAPQRGGGCPHLLECAIALPRARHVAGRTAAHADHQSEHDMIVSAGERDVCTLMHTWLC
jgi:hypothetical protein